MSECPTMQCTQTEGHSGPCTIPQDIGLASVLEAEFTHDPRAWDHALAYVQHMAGTLRAAAEQHMQLLAQSMEAMSARYDAITQIGAELEQLRAEIQQAPEGVAELPERIRAMFEKWYEESVSG